MAILSNINEIFRVDSAGAVYFGTSAGTNGLILKSVGTGGSPVWVDPNTVGTGPWLPLAGGDITGDLTVGGTLGVTGAQTGTTATFTRLEINASNTKIKGDLLAYADAAYDIGASAANRPRNLYLSNSINAADITTTGVGTFGTTVTGSSIIGTSRVQSDDNMMMVAGQFYIGASGGSVDDTYRFYAASGVYYLQSRKSGTWTSYLEIASDGDATFYGSVTAPSFNGSHMQNPLKITSTYSSGNNDILFSGGSTTGVASNTTARIRNVATAPGGAATGDLIFTVNSGDTFVNALALSSDGNATFAKEISSGDDINCPTKIVLGESASPEVRLKKTDTGVAKVTFYSANSEKSYIELDASEDMVYYAISGIKQKFYSNAQLTLTLESQNATFGGDVTTVGNVVAGSSITLGASNGRVTALQGIFGSAFCLTSDGKATFGSTSSSIPIALAIDGAGASPALLIATNNNATFAADIIGNSAGTTEIGAYPTGGIKRIMMGSGGEIHFGDTTTSSALGLTEGAWDQFGDTDRLGLYCRNELKVYGNSNVLRLTIPTNGDAAFASGATFTGMITVQGGGIDIDNNDDLRLRFDNASVFKAGLQVPTTAGDMITGSAINDFAIRSQSNMLFATGGATERMRIDSAGNTTVYNDFIISNGSPEFYMTTGATHYNWLLAAQESINAAFQISSQPAAGGSYDNHLVILGGSGNVGIGTDSPDAKLEVSGDILLSPTNKIGWRYVSGNGYFNFITGEDQILTLTGGTWTSAATQTAVRIKTQQGEKVTIRNNGNVGIGTTSPLKILTVKKATSTTDIGTSEVMRLAGTAQAVGNRNELGFANYDFDYNASVVIGVEIMSTLGYLKQDLYFATRESTTDVAPTERMRIESTGYIKIADDGDTTWQGYNFHAITQSRVSEPTVMIYNDNTGGNNFGVNVIHRSSGSSTTGRFFFGGTSNGSTEKIKIYTNGSIENATNSYGQLSDLKLKENVVDATSKLDDIMKVKIKNFNYIGDDLKQLGVIAQELEEVFPGLVYDTPDSTITNKKEVFTGTSTKGVKYSIFVPMLIKAMQEQQVIIEDFKSRLKILEKN